MEELESLICTALIVSTFFLVAALPWLVTLPAEVPLLAHLATDPIRGLVPPLAKVTTSGASVDIFVLV